MKNVKKVGWLGTGVMGEAMAANLLKQGFPVSVYNRSQDKTKALVAKGAYNAGRPVDLWQKAEVVFVMVSDDAASEAVLLGRNGLLSQEKAATGKTIVNCSTISPECAQKLADASVKVGVRYVDAPVSGSVWAAEDATLLFLIGGEEKELSDLIPLFDAMGKKNFFLQKITQGNKAKLAINYLIAVNYLALGETVLFAERMGIPKVAMLEIINNSGAGNITTKAKTQPIIDDRFEPVAFTLAHMLKDVKLAAAQGNSFPLMTGLLPAYEHAVAAGFADKDVMEIIHFLKGNESSF